MYFYIINIVMIANFNTEGYLPEGIHECTLQELEERFTFNLKRKKLFEGLSRLIHKLGSIHCKVIYIDGSFVSEKQLPSDVDVCFECAEENWEFAVLMVGDFWKDQESFQRDYNCNVFPSNLFIEGGKLYYLDFFQRIKNTNIPKGILKIKL